MPLKNACLVSQIAAAFALVLSLVGLIRSIRENTRVPA